MLGYSNTVTILLSLLWLLVPYVIGQGTFCPSSGGCLQEAAMVNRASCTANDITMGDVIACKNGICSPDVIIPCNVNEPITLDFRFHIMANPQRYDVGVFIGTDGQPDARFGDCCRFIISPPQTNLDGDGCGDVLANTGYYQRSQFTVECAASATGHLLLPYCISWSQDTHYRCTDAITLVPGTGSKCNCSNIEVQNVIVRAPDVEWLNPPLCYTATSLPLILPFRVLNLASTQGSFQITNSLNDEMRCCNANDDCVITLTTPIATFPRNVLAGQFLKCAVIFDGSNLVQTPVTITAQVSIIGGATQTTTSPTITISFVDVEITQFSLTYDLTVDQINWDVRIRNNGAPATLALPPPLSSVCASGITLNTNDLHICTFSEPAPSSTTIPRSCTTDRSVSVSLTAGACTDTDSKSSNIVLNGRECRPKNGDCDIQEFCQSSGTCPADGFDPNFDCSEIPVDIRCTRDECVRNTSPQFGFSCQHTKLNELCDPCACAPGQCVANGSLDLWSDGCRHFFGQSVIPLADAPCCAPNSGNARCTVPNPSP